MNSHDFPAAIEVAVSVRWPNFGQQRSVRFRTLVTTKDAFQPIPRDWDVLFLFNLSVSRQVDEIRQLRRELVKSLSNKFAEQLLKILSEYDPVRGVNPNPNAPQPEKRKATK